MKTLRLPTKRNSRCTILSPTSRLVHVSSSCSCGLGAACECCVFLSVSAASNVLPFGCHCTSLMLDIIVTAFRCCSRQIPSYKQQWQNTCCLFRRVSSLMQAELVTAKRHSTTESERQQKMVTDLDMRTKELRQAQSNYNKSVRQAIPLR